MAAAALERNDGNVRTGKYWFRTGPEFSRVQDDRDARTLRDLREVAMPTLPLRGPRDWRHPLAFRFEGDADLAWQFQAAAAAEGVRTSVQPPASGRPIGTLDARLGAGLDLVTYVVFGVAFVRALAGVALRLVHGLARGVLVEVDEEYDEKHERKYRVTVTTPAGLPRGTVIVKKPDGTQVEPADDSVTSVVEVILQVLRGRHHFDG